MRPHKKARVESLRSLRVEYADLVDQGLELPVVELSVRYGQELLRYCTGNSSRTRSREG